MQGYHIADFENSFQAHFSQLFVCENTVFCVFCVFFITIMCVYIVYMCACCVQNVIKKCVCVVRVLCAYVPYVCVKCEQHKHIAMCGKDFCVPKNSYPIWLTKDPTLKR